MGALGSVVPAEAVCCRRKAAYWDVVALSRGCQARGDWTLVSVVTDEDCWVVRNMVFAAPAG